tara:strand:- start:165 stop:539 length:375 start_codon:yes stop_codon:yes gene_type:complete
MSKNPIDLLKSIANLLDEKKSFQIFAMDVTGISSITDFVLIASGNVERHVIALAKEIEKFMKKNGESSHLSEGMDTGDWVVLDYFKFTVHIQIPEIREKYRLEGLWPDAKIIDLGVKNRGTNFG